MGTNFKAATSTTAFDGVQECGVMVPAIHPIERPVVHRLQAIFHGQIGTPGDLRQEIQKTSLGTLSGRVPIRHRDDLGVCQGLLVDGAQAFDGSVGIRRGLEIGSKMVAIVTAF